MASGAEATAAATDSAYAQALEIEASLHGFPKRAQDELAVLLARADAAPATERRYIYALYGQAAAAAGRNDEALALADRLEREASAPAEKPLLATAQAHAQHDGMAGGRRRQGQRIREGGPHAARRLG